MPCRMCGARSIGTPLQVTATPPALPMMSDKGNSPLSSRTVPDGWVPVIRTAPDASLTSIHESAGKRMTRGLSGAAKPAAPVAPDARGTVIDAGQGGGAAGVEADAAPCAATGAGGAATLGTGETGWGLPTC